MVKWGEWGEWGEKWCKMVKWGEWGGSLDSPKFSKFNAHVKTKQKEKTKTKLSY